VNFLSGISPNGTREGTGWGACVVDFGGN
jgi:hypothetical protein